MSNAALWVRVSTLMQDETNQLPAMQQALDDGYRGEFKVLIVWAIDRICREGPEEFLRLFRQLRERGVTLVSIQEPWLNNSDATTEILMCFAAWVAKQESVRHSERVKIGLEKRRAKGLPVGGRQAGARDRKPRKRRSGPANPA